MAARWADVLRTWSRRPGLQDAALAAALLAACVLINAPSQTVVTAAGPVVQADLGPDVLGWWIATAFAVCGVALRRRWPVPMLVVCTLAAGAHLALLVPLMIIDLSVPILLYTVAVRHGRPMSLALLVWLLLVVAGWSLYAANNHLSVPGLPDRFSAAEPPPASGDQPSSVQLRQGAGVLQDTWSGVLVLGSVLLASWAMGSSTRSSRAYLQQLHARAQDLERERDQQAVLAAAEERERISRELHDVVAHGLSVMVTQAQGAAAALDNQPGDTRTALSAIVETGRESLADMRRVLARMDGTDHPWRPQPGLADLPALVTQVTDAQTPVQLRIEGTPTTLPPQVDLSAYRIVQEALTNTMKHAGPGASATVVLTYGDTHVQVEIRDTGSGVTGTDDRGGNGLRGMRERARLLGGQLTAGAGPTGGFVVRATLPILEPDT